MDLHKLELLLNRGESPKVDFKAEFHLKNEHEKKELARDIIALANTKGGRGYLIYGVADKTKEILGIEPKLFKEETIVQVINTRVYPPIPVGVETIVVEDKTVVVIVVFKSELKPHQMIQNGAFYVRRGTTTDVARREELASMFQEKGLFSYERILMHRLGLEVLDMNKVARFFGDKLLVLEAVGIIGQYNDDWHPTYGGLLLFGHKPQDFLSHTYLKMITEDEIVVIDGSIHTMMEQAETFCRFHCKDQEYPIEGLLEAIMNALIHRDYLDTSSGITFTVDERYITVNNPGSLVPGNKLYKNKVNENPRRRNPWLYQRALLMDDDKRVYKYGLGIDRINNMFEHYGHVKYVNLDSKNLFKVVLPSWYKEK